MLNYLKVFKKIIKGEDISIVRQSKEKWNSQFEKGNWDFLVENVNRKGHIGIIGMMCGQLGKEKNLKILDIGCGNGSVAMILKDQIGEKLDYYGIDISEKALEALKKNVDKANLFCTDAENPPQFPEKFDVIIFCEVLYYLDYKKVLKIYKSFLNKDGFIIISMYSALRNWYIWQKIKKYFVLKSSFRIINKNDRLKWDLVLAQYAEFN